MLCGANPESFRRNRGIKRVLQERGAKVPNWIWSESGHAVDLRRCLHGNVLFSQDREQEEGPGREGLEAGGTGCR